MPVTEVQASNRHDVYKIFVSIFYMSDSFLSQVQDYDLKVETKDGVFYLREPEAGEIIDYMPILSTPNQFQGAQREMMYEMIKKFIVKVEKDGKTLQPNEIELRRLKISTIVKLTSAINQLLDITPNE